MKKIVLMVLLLLMFEICAYAEDNTIFQCDFEEQDKYFQNTDKEYSIYSGLNVSQDDAEGYAGTGALKIESENEGSSIVTKIYQDGAVNSNLNTSDKYTLSFYAKVPKGSSISGIDVAYSYNRLTNTIETPIVSKTIEGSDYVRISAEFSITSISRFSLIIKPVGTGVIYIDEFMIGKTVSPKIVKEKCIPADGSFDVEPADEIFICFNKEMDAASLENAEILINDSSEDIEEITMSEDETGCLVKLKKTMEYAFEYTVSISGMYDYNGTEASGVFSFTTGEERGETVAFIDYDTSNPSRYTSWLSTVEVTTENAYKGNSVKVTMTGTSSNYQVVLPMEKGILYKYSFMASCSEAGKSLPLAINIGNEVYKKIGSANQVPSNGEYKKYEGTIYIPTTEVIGETKFDFYGTSGTFYIDDIMLTKESDFAVTSSYPEDGGKRVSAEKPVEFGFNYAIGGVENITLNGAELKDSEYRIDDKSLYIYNVGGGAFEYGTVYDIEIGTVTDAYGRTVKNLTKSFTTIDEFDINAAELIKSGNERTLKLTQIMNNTAANRELTLKVIAIKDGELIKSSSKKFSVPARGTTDAELTLSLRDITASGYKVKGLVWDEKYGIMPIIKHVEEVNP